MNAQKAFEYYEASVTVRLEYNLPPSTGTLNNLSKLYATQGNFKKAHEYGQQCLMIRRAENDLRGIGRSILSFAFVAAYETAWERVVVLSEAGKKILLENGYVLRLNEETEYQERMSVARTWLEKSVFNFARLQGSNMSMDEAIAYTKTV